MFCCFCLSQRKGCNCCPRIWKWDNGLNFGEDYPSENFIEYPIPPQNNSLHFHFNLISLQVFHCHFNSNFFPLFLDKLLVDSISPQTGSILLGVSFVAPHINNLYFLGLCRRFGVYSVIKWLFYVKLTLSVLMLTFGPNWPILLCFYIAR